VEADDVVDPSVEAVVVVDDDDGDGDAVDTETFQKYLL